MPALKCPNPQCTFQFDPSKVPAGATIACPQCRKRFKLNSIPTAPSPFQELGGNEITSRRHHTSETTSIWNSKGLIVAIICFIALGLGVFVYALVSTRKPAVVQTPEQEFTDHNVAIRPPVEPWERDRDVETALLLNLGVYKRANPDAWVGFAAQKFNDRNARKLELVNFLKDRLKKLCESVNVDERESENWLGQPAVKLEFRGTTKAQLVIAGECYGVSVKGIAYYFFSWAQERDVAGMVAEFTELRQQIRTLTLRNNWKETKVSGTIFASKKLDYKLIDREGLWKEPKNQFPTDEDPIADLLLRAEYIPKGLKGDTKYKADLFVYILPAAADANRAAIDYITTRQSRNPEIYKEFMFEEWKDPIQGDELQGDVPDDLIATTRFKMTHPKNPDSSRLIVISAMESNGKVVAVEGTCLWREKEIWERRLVNLVGSLKSTVEK